jgi:hypothetical protein
MDVIWVKVLCHSLIQGSVGDRRTSCRSAVQAPSAHNTQPWSFMLIQDRNRLESLSAEAKARLIEDFWDDPRMHPYRDLLSNEKFDIFYGAPLLVIICAEDDPIMPVEQCFLAAENLMLAAQDRGLGTCCIGWALGAPVPPSARGQNRARDPRSGHPRAPDRSRMAARDP